MKLLICLTAFYILTCISPQVSIAQNNEIFEVSPRLSITKLNDRSYIHTSYGKLKNGDKFPCNGFIYVINKKAMVFEAPISENISKELISWIENGLQAEIKSVVINHFHQDSAGGLAAFKKHGITSYAYGETSMLLSEKGKTVPDNSFPKQLKLSLEKMEIWNTFLGPAHSPDNIVSYFPNENILFGGCMIKAFDAEKGNLKDANLDEWSNTVKKVKASFPNVTTIIPGHGNYGGWELLDYTIELFKKTDP